MSTLGKTDRRSVLQGAGLVAAAQLLAAPFLITRAAAQSIGGTSLFTLGLASGDPAPDGFVIWTRLAKAPFDGGGMGNAPVDVAWEIAGDEQFKSVVRKGQAAARADTAHAVHVEIAGLDPARDYFYRFTAGGQQSTTGRARTLPAAGADPAELRFASAGCQRFEHGLFTAWRHLAAERLDLVVHYGDYIYEYAQIKPGADPKTAQIRRMPRDYPVCRTIEDYRNRYAVYKSDADLQAAHASCPFVMSFDDHEVVNNIAGSASNAAERARRAAAFKAWWEHMPLRRAQIPKGPDILAYRRLEVGRLATLHVLDTRQYRSKQACGDLWKVCPAAAAPERTMLGAAQEAWLDSGLAAARTRWNVLAQQVPMMRRVVRGTDQAEETHMDKWDGAPTARQRLFDSITRTKASGIVVLTGDVHQNWAGDLKADFAVPSSATLGVEIVATSISSGGDGGIAAGRLATLRTDNPHFRYFNNERGYVRHVVRADRWEAHFRTVVKVSVPDQPIITRKVMATEVGKPGIVDG